MDRRVTAVNRRLSKEHPISRSLLAPIFSDSEFTPAGHAATLLKKGKLMEQLAGARELQKRRVSLADMKLLQYDLPMSCRTILLSLGVIGRRSRTNRDYIWEVLANLYGCQSPAIWRQLLGSEYEHAWQILREAETRFPGNPSDWLGLQDSFNNIVVRQFFDFLKNCSLGGHSKTIDRKGDLVDYGKLIAKRTPFDSSYSQVADVLRILHDRRNRIPGSHPYSKKGGSQSRWLTKVEQKTMVPKLKIAFDNIASVVQQNI